jgi:hypothetical protein
MLFCIGYTGSSWNYLSILLTAVKSGQEENVLYQQSPKGTQVLIAGSDENKALPEY